MSSSPLPQSHLRKPSSRTSSSFACDSLSLRRPRSSGTDPSFVCTICWQPQYPPPDASSSSFGPKLLGSSARIVCRACWCAVLDLSICWVCGECIVRGDEVVSLGWCFWHGGCFGCLVCGMRMSDTNLFNDTHEDRRWGSWVGSKEDERLTRRRNRSAGWELDEIPLCSVCRIETAGESQGEVLERGLDTVSRFDGGLSRDRLDMLSEDRVGEVRRAPRMLVRTPRRLKGATGIESELKRYINGSSTGSTRQNVSEFACADDQNPLLLDTADMGISEDGAPDGHYGHIGSGDSDLSKCFSENADVYVSIFDPVGGSAFKPSPTKPLPKWMALLPSNVKRGRKRERQRASNSEGSNQLSDKPRGSTNSRNSYTSHSSGSYDQLPPTDTPDVRGPVLKSEGTSPPINVPQSGRRVRNISFQGDELELSSTRASRKSQTFESIYSTPPEFPARSITRRHPTPFPRMSRPTLDRSDSSSYFTQSIDSAVRPGLVVEHLSSPDMQSDSQETTPTKPPRHSGAPMPSTQVSLSMVTQSSEYLERYQPRTPSLRHQKYIAKQPEAILDKIKRQKVGSKNMGQVAEEIVKKRKSVDRNYRLEDEEYGLDPRRADLKKELKKLFYEE